MEILKTALQSLPTIAITVALEYRFGCKTLGLRISKVLAFGVMLIVQLIAGQLNMRFQLAASGDASMIYYGAITLLLYLILFKGSMAKKLFFAMFIRCGIPTSYFILLSFVGCLFGQVSEDFIFALRMLEYVNVVLSIVLIEYTGKKFQNLRRELPTGYTIYLSVVLLFVHMAVFSGYDVMLVRNAGIVPQTTCDTLQTSYNKRTLILHIRTAKMGFPFTLRFSIKNKEGYHYEYKRNRNWGSKWGEVTHPRNRKGTAERWCPLTGGQAQR